MKAETPHHIIFIYMIGPVKPSQKWTSYRPDNLIPPQKLPW